MRRKLLAKTLPLAIAAMVSSTPAQAGMHSSLGDTNLVSTSSTLQPTFQFMHTMLVVNAIFDHLASLGVTYPINFSGLSSGDEPQGINVWATPYTTFAKDTNASTGYESNTNGIFFGGDYKIDDQWTAGLMMGADHTEVDSKVNGGGADTIGFTVAPYGRYAIDKNYSVDASFGYTNSSSDNDRLNSGTRITSESDVDRLFFSVGMNGSYWQDRWNFAGRLATTNSYDSSDAYTESDGTTVAKKNTTFGQVQVGGTVSYYFENIRPWLSATYAYDYDRKLPSVGATQLKPSDDRNQLVLGYGATLFDLGAVTADFSVKHTLFKTNYDNTNIGLSFSTSF